MEGTIRWIDDVMFVAESGSGHTVVIDGPPDDGGRNIGIRPMELVLLGVGGCTSFDIISILKKARQPVTDCVTRISARRSDDVPSVFTSIHIQVTVTGRGLKERQVARAVELSADKYCSASIMLGRAGVEITHDFEIVEEDDVQTQ